MVEWVELLLPPGVCFNYTHRVRGAEACDKVLLQSAGGGGAVGFANQRSPAGGGGGKCCT